VRVEGSLPKQVLIDTCKKIDFLNSCRVKPIIEVVCVEKVFGQPRSFRGCQLDQNGKGLGRYIDEYR